MRALIIIALAALSAVPVSAQEQASPSGPWRIFFDWSKPDIRGDYDATLVAAAEQFKAAPGSVLGLAGHSDRSGPAGANRAASRRRAEAVRARLVALGVPTNSIRMIVLGEQQPLVPTEDGVREVQNRRVDLWLIPAP